MKVSLIDFKSHANTEVEFSGTTQIKGRNGEGKTSILEGIVFTLFGRNFYGKMSTDVFIKRESPCATAIVELDGTEIKRTQGEDSSVYLNGAKSRVAEVGGLFPSVDVCMPIINPLYFMYEMSDSIKRELFMKLLPTLDREELFKKHYSDRKDLVDRFKSSTLSRIREQLKSNETILKVNASQSAAYELDITLHKEEIKEIRKGIPKTPAGILKKEKALQVQLETVQKDISLLGNPIERVKEYEAELEGYRAEAQPIVKKLQVQNLTGAVEKMQVGLATIQTRYDVEKKSLAEDEVLLGQLEKFKDGTCPVCEQPVGGGVDRFEALKITMEGQEERVEELEEKVVKYTRIYKSLVDLKDNVLRCSNGMAVWKKKITRYKNLLKKAKELEGKLVGNTKEDFAKAVEIERLRATVKQVQNEVMRKKGSIARLKITSGKLENDLPDLVLLEEALSKKGVDAWIAKEHAKTIEKLLSKYVKVQVVTVLENKTNDNTKEVFEVTKDGVSFRSMSFGERLQMSIAFGLVLRKLVDNFNIPFVLLDEGSVLSKKTLDQIIEWVESEGCYLIYTKASNSALQIISTKEKK